MASDSLTLLKILALRKKWIPIKYDITACHIVSNNICAECHNIKELKKFCGELDCEYMFAESSLVGEKREFSCFWCAWNRRKILFESANKGGFTKVALGHHMDDVVETTLMNLFFHREISSLNVKQHLFDGKITIIRPVVCLEERTISRYAKEAELPITKCKCPNAEKSRRRYVKDLIGELNREFKYVKKNIMNAPHKIKEEYLGVKYG